MNTRTLPPTDYILAGLRPLPTPPLTDAQIAAIEARKSAADARWDASPHRRFVLACEALEALSWAEEGHYARQCMSRGFMAPERPADPVEVGAALKALAGINHSHAREAVAALGEVLTTALAKAS